MHKDHHILTKINPGNDQGFVFIYDVPSSSTINDFKMKARGGVTGEEVIIPFNFYDKIQIE